MRHARGAATDTVHDDSGDESDRDDSAADTGNAAPADASSDTSDRCEVCLLQPRAGVALVPCGHSGSGSGLLTYNSHMARL